MKRGILVREKVLIIKNIDLELNKKFENLEKLKLERNHLYRLYKKEMISSVEMILKREELDKKIFSIETILLKKADISAKKETKKNIRVTEHALLRYLERVEGINLKEIEKKILTENLKKHINYFGDGIYHFDEGKNKVVVENSKIITVISNKGDEKNI